MASITMKELLEAGVHFGHQKKRWNPKMKPYIFGERNGIYILDLQQTLNLFKQTTRFVSELASQGKNFLFVGTKRQAQDAIAEEAVRCNMFYVNQRWLGGLLTNFATIQKSVSRLKELEAMKEDGRYELLPKKEVLRLERARMSLDKNLSGIKNMPGLPDAVFVIDSRREEIAVAEARRLKIPVMAVVDTNCDPEVIDHVIPGNDDALRAIRLFTSRIADAILEGQQLGVKAKADESAPLADSPVVEPVAAVESPAVEPAQAVESPTVEPAPAPGPDDGNPVEVAAQPREIPVAATEAVTTEEPSATE